MFVLFLNDMRSPKIEIVQPVLRAETMQQLLDFMAAERVEPYSDNGLNVLPHTTDQLAGTVDLRPAYNYRKVFRKDGPLEWFNAPFSDDHARNECIRDIGTLESWLENTRQEWNQKVMTIPAV